MWRFAEIVLKSILGKLGTKASEEDLTRNLHRHLLDLQDVVGQTRAYLQYIVDLSDELEGRNVKNIVKDEIKTVKSLSWKLLFCATKISRNIRQLRFFLARKNCESIYHEIETILGNILDEEGNLLADVNLLDGLIKARNYELIDSMRKSLYEQAQSLKPIEANIQKSIDELLSFSGGPQSRGA